MTNLRHLGSLTIYHNEGDDDDNVVLMIVCAKPRLGIETRRKKNYIRKKGYIILYSMVDTHRRILPKSGMLLETQKKDNFKMDFFVDRIENLGRYALTQQNNQSNISMLWTKKSDDFSLSHLALLFIRLWNNVDTDAHKNMV